MRISETKEAGREWRRGQERLREKKKREATTNVHNQERTRKKKQAGRGLSVRRGKEGEGRIKGVCARACVWWTKASSELAKRQQTLA